MSRSRARARSSSASASARRGGGAPGGGRSSSQNLPSRRVPLVDVSCARKNEDAIAMAVDILGWGLTRGSGGSVVWVVQKDDVAEQLKRLRRGQLLSHLPGMQEACCKIALAEACQSRNVSFWPWSWRLMGSNLDTICKEAFRGKASAAVIVKPDGGAHGNGIALARSPAELRKAAGRLGGMAAIVQEYIDRPLLLDGFKWDARIYALVLPGPAGGLRCFLAQDGLVRVCVDPYEPPEPRNIHRLTMHCTNYSLSKFSDKFSFNEDPTNAHTGCKRTLSAVLSRLEAEPSVRLNAAGTWQALGALARETVSAMAGAVRAFAAEPGSWDGNAELAERAAERFGQCFHIVGIDVLLDETGRPWLMEANNNPSLSLDEVRPLADVKTLADANKVFSAASRKDGRPGAEPDASLRSLKWGRPCRCMQHPRPHAHYQCPVDVFVKVPVVCGALVIARRAQQAAQAAEVATADGGHEAWAQGTAFRAV